jgi:hypothetical protein
MVLGLVAVAIFGDGELCAETRHVGEAAEQTARIDAGDVEVDQKVK